MITKSFQFDPMPEPGKRGKVRLVVNDESFDLADDLTGIELLTAIANNGTARGAVQFLQRVVTDDDWVRFGAVTAGAKPAQLGKLVDEALDAYSGFPTTPGDDSSPGQSTTGSTSESNSSTPESTPTAAPQAS